MSPRAAQLHVVVGVFAGGRGVRMGGRDKARLPAPGTGEALADRLLRLAAELGVARAVLVGGAQLAQDSDGVVSVPRLEDDPPGIGPIGGLCALLAHAAPQPAIALACDLPYVSAALLARLIREQPNARVLAPRDPITGKWEPLFARYATELLPELRAAVASGTRSMQTVLQRLEVCELPLCPAERAELRDWDRPEDM